jgi:hypothetical protein
VLVLVERGLEVVEAEQEEIERLASVYHETQRQGA